MEDTKIAAFVEYATSIQGTYIAAISDEVIEACIYILGEGLIMERQLTLPDYRETPP
ncbi:hypothetical protein BGZ58_005319, partial [Dissophora ornata]